MQNNVLYKHIGDYFMIKRYKLIGFAAVAAAFLLLSCKNNLLTKTEKENSGEIPVKNIILSPNKSELSLEKNTAHLITVKIIPEKATNKALIYSSKHGDIASIDNTGLITAKKEGRTIITIEALNGVKKTINVTVTPEPIPVTGISLIPHEDTISLVDGTDRKIEAHVIPENATNKKLTFSLDNQEIASITEDGKITAKAVGSANITIKAADGISKTVKLTVTAASVSVTSIEFEEQPANPIELVIGESYELKLKVMPEDATNKELRITSSSDDIAWPNGDGNRSIKAVGEGETTVTITSVDNSNVSKMVHFKMKPKPSLRIKTSSAICGSDGGNVTFKVETLNGKLKYTPVVVGSGAKWLEITNEVTTTETEDTIHLNVFENKTVWYRNAYIKFKGTDDKYIKGTDNKDLQVKIIQQQNMHPKVTIKWVKGIKEPTETEKKEIEVLDSDGIFTGTYHNTDYVFNWYETLTTTFFNTRKVTHTYVSYGGYKGPYPDGNQCWAKTDSNMLHWWFEQNKDNIKEYIEKKGIDDNDDRYKPFYKRELLDNQEDQKSSIAKIFQEKCINKGGNPANGLQWYLFGLNGFGNAKDKRSSPALFNDVFNKGNTPIKQERIYTKKELESMVKDALDSEKAVGINIFGVDTSQHAITLWGAAFDADGNIIAIYVVDNNEVPNRVFPYGIWYKEGVDIYDEAEPEIDQNDPHRFNPYLINYSSNRPDSKHYIGEITTLDKGEAQWKKWLEAHQ